MGKANAIEDELRAIMEDMEEKSKDPERQAEYERIESARAEAAFDSFMRYSGIPRLYADSSFDDYEVIPSNKEAYNACREYVNSWKDGKRQDGMAIFGSVGVGKTHLAISVLKEIFEKYDTPGKYANVLHTFELTRWSFDGRSTNPIVDILRTPFLVLDDLGSERPSVWTVEQLAHIMDYRLSECLPMIITSNAMDWKDLSKMLLLERRGDPESRVHLELSIMRIMDRMHDAVGTPVKIIGKSWRGNNRKASAIRLL